MFGHEIDLDGEDALGGSSLEVLSNVVQEYRLKCVRECVRESVGECGRECVRECERV